MGQKLLCKNCEYFVAYVDSGCNRIDGQCNKLRMSPAGFVPIATTEKDFCSKFVKRDLKTEDKKT